MTAKEAKLEQGCSDGDQGPAGSCTTLVMLRRIESRTGIVSAKAASIAMKNLIIQNTLTNRFNWAIWIVFQYFFYPGIPKDLCEIEYRLSLIHI